MASVPKKYASSPSSHEESLEQRFRRLEEQWLAQAGHFSSTQKLTAHPAFREIVALGDAVVPYLLQDLQKRPRLWVWALQEITGADPVPASDRGNIGKMSAAWLQWAKENGWQW